MGFPLPPGFTPIGTLNGAASGTLTKVVQTVSSVQALSANSARVGAYFYNDSSSANAYLAFALTSSLGAYTIRLTTSGSVVLSAPVYCGPVFVTWDAAGAGQLRVTETQ